ncbi:MAG: hypothetical protein ACK52I_01745 [Pseudomonadota bacterium]|jgi:chromosome segregation ATPase
MTTTIEPTQEQRDAATKFCDGLAPIDDELARFLAEREAKVRDEANAVVDLLTARNAALLTDKSDLSRQLRRVEEDRDAAHAEVVALKAKLAKAEASLREVLNLAHGADEGLTLADCIPTEVAARAENALAPAGAGTEWAAPIAAVDEKGGAK